MTAGQQHVPVIVVGAGPTGISAAILLGSHGVRCLVLDRWEDVYPQPRAVHLDDEVHRVLQQLGVAGEFTAISRPARGLRLVDTHLRVLAEFQRSESAAVHGWPQANMFDQPGLEALLRRRLATVPEVTVRGGVEVTALTQSPGGPVTVTVTDTTTGRPAQLTADYVLGCDGAHSTVRRSIGSTMRDLGFQQRWLVLDIETGAELHQWEGVHQVCDPTRPATYMRIGPRRYRWEFRLHAHEDAAAFGTLADVHHLLLPWTGDLPADQLTLVRSIGYTFRAQLADRWRVGQVFCLGDAAHLTPPFIGQGLGAGLRDAHNLGWKLAGVLRGDLPAAVLDSYEAERVPHVRSMIRTAIGIGRVMSGGGAGGQLVRRVVLPRLRLVPGLRRRVLDSTTPALHRSSMVLGPPLHLRRTGALCPNLRIDATRRVDDLPATFLLLTTVEPTLDQRRNLTVRGAGVLVVAPGSGLGRWLARGHVRAAVLRPDRTVFLAGHDVAVLCDAVPRFRHLDHSAAPEPRRRV